MLKARVAQRPRAPGAVRRGDEAPTRGTRSDSHPRRSPASRPGAGPPRRWSARWPVAARAAARTRGGPHGGGSHGGYGGRRSPSARPDRGLEPSAACTTGPARATHRGQRGQERTRGLARGYGYGYNAGAATTTAAHGYYNGGRGDYRPHYGYRLPSVLPLLPVLPALLPLLSYWPGVSLSFGWGYGSSLALLRGVATTGAPATRWVSTRPGSCRGRLRPRAYRLRRPRRGALVRRPLRSSEAEVRPDDASVYVDDEFRGTAREARIMSLPHRPPRDRAGPSRVATERRDVTVVSGESQDVLVEPLRP